MSSCGSSLIVKRKHRAGYSINVLAGKKNGELKKIEKTERKLASVFKFEEIEKKNVKTSGKEESSFNKSLVLQAHKEDVSVKKKFALHCFTRQHFLQC